MLHFSRFEDFEMLDATLRLEFDNSEEMWALFSSPPGPLAGALRAGADAGELREELFDLVAGERRQSTAGVALDIAYAVVLGRRQTVPRRFFTFPSPVSNTGRPRPVHPPPTAPREESAP